MLPTDVPNTPNLTWTATKPVSSGAVFEGFSATTSMAGMVEGQYVAQATRQALAVQGVAADAPGDSAMTSKQAMIGVLPMPYFLAPTK